MKTHVLTGSKKEIAEMVARIDGEIREVIVYVDEPAAPNAAPPPSEEDMWAEMEPYTVKVGGADYSRAAIYTRMEGE